MAPTQIQILLVDNYDSFTYNIAHCVRNQPGVNLQIIKADDIDPDKVALFDKIIFSPGPDLPGQGNIMEKILEKFAAEKSILGICLGLQAIWLFYGGRLRQLEEPFHGRKKLVSKTDNRSCLLNDIPPDFEAGFYHSWAADNTYTPEHLTITARTEDGLIMGIRHREYDIEAVQFHPESILTPLGNVMISSWLKG